MAERAGQNTDIKEILREFLREHRSRTQSPVPFRISDIEDWAGRRQISFNLGELYEGLNFLIRDGTLKLWPKFPFKEDPYLVQEEV
jgi:hypothetical protein